MEHLWRSLFELKGGPRWRIECEACGLIGAERLMGGITHVSKELLPQGECPGGNSLRRTCTCLPGDGPCKRCGASD